MNESQSNSFLAEQPVGALMRKFSLPCILSLLVGALYNIVDQLFIANASYLGSYGNAANSVVFPLTVIALAIATMIGDGCCAYVSIRLGAGEPEQAHRSVGNAIVLTLIVSVVLMAVYLIFMDPILTAFGATVNAETFALSREYCFWIALGIPFYMFGQAMNPIIRSDGSPRYAMLSLLAGAVCNIILDPIFIFPCGWGMMGAAVATVIGQILSAVLAAAYLPPLLLNRALPSAAVYAVCGLAAAGGVWGAAYLLHFSGYRRVYRHLFTADAVSLLSGDGLQAAARETQAQYQSKLTLDAGPDSRKTGCARFNELFVRRNYRLLMRPARRTAVIAGAALAPGCAACLALPEIAAAINGALVPALPMMLLLMYFINRGNTVTQVLFFNCDSSMLSYRFYRQPRVILGIFAARLKSLTAINLLPTAVIALGLPLLLLCSGGTDTPTDYLVLPLAILAMSVFFSVHYLVLYYLLQPYTAGLENTSFGYRLITGLTYFVCYMIYANVHGATMAFGIGMIVFAAVYVAAALLLAYRLAPRTFKLRT